MFKDIVLAVIAVGFGLLLNAQSVSSGLKEEANIYGKVFDAPLRVAENDSLLFHGLYNRKPLILALVFTRCYGVCNPFLLRLAEYIQLRDKDDSFSVLVLSFDPKDSVDDMKLLGKRYGLENNTQWTFAVTDSIESLNRSIGFYPSWDSSIEQFDHDALLVGINSEGFITKKLIGIRQPHDLDLLIASVNNIFSPTYRLPNRNALFSCFNYDPKTGKNTPGLGLLFIALPAIVTVILLLSISYFVRHKPLG